MTHYTGQDRRRARAVASIRIGRLAVWGGCAGAGMFAAGAVLLTSTPLPAALLWPLTVSVWCTSSLGAGLVLLCAWRIGGQAMPARLGAALVVCGALIPLVPLVVAELLSVGEHGYPRSLAVAVVLLVAGAMIVQAMGSADVDTTLHPIREISVRSAVAVVVGATVVFHAPLLPTTSDAVRLAPGAVALAYALAVWWRGIRNEAHRRASQVVAIALAFVAAGLSLRVFPDSAAVELLMAACLATAGGLFGGVAAEVLRASLQVQQARSLTTVATLARFKTAAELERERRHDALSALSAIRSASSVLTSSGATLQAATREELVTAVRAELSRVERLLSPEPQSALRQVDVAAALRPVVLGWRQRGLVVAESSETVTVRTDPDALNRLMNNLLNNVVLHAPGASVRIGLRQADDAVHISVIDDGPGIPAQRRGDVFEPGVQLRPSGLGEGLGLASAKRLAAELGGDLRLVDVDTGCWFLLTLPLDAGSADLVHSQPGDSRGRVA